MLYFHGFGHFHPENEIDNAFLESLDIGTNDQWIVERVGIKNRRTVLPLDYIRATKNQDLRAAPEAALYSNAETGRRAAPDGHRARGPQALGHRHGHRRRLLARHLHPGRGLARRQAPSGIDGPRVRPARGVQHLRRAFHFLYRMGPAACPTTSCSSAREHHARPSTSPTAPPPILFGDATSAAVVSTKVPGRARGVSTPRSAPTPRGADEVTIPRTRPLPPERLGRAEVRDQEDAVLLERDRGPPRRGAQRELIYIGHQANLTMLESGVPPRARSRPSATSTTSSDFGNQCAAGAPVVLSQSWDRFQPGDVAALVVVGSGLSWASIQLEF